MCAQPCGDHQRSVSYPPSSMNAWYAAFVTGVVSIQNGATSRGCAGRSLSSAQGSLEVPMVNGPPGTRTSAGPVNSGAGSGSGAVSACGPFRS